MAADIRDIRERTVADLKRGGLSSEKAEAAGKRLENIMTRREQGLPVSDRPSILHDRRPG